MTYHNLLYLTQYLIVYNIYLLSISLNKESYFSLLKSESNLTL